MKKFVVGIQEVHICRVLVEAETDEDAIHKAMDAQGIILDTKYDYMMDDCNDFTCVPATEKDLELAKEKNNEQEKSR